VGLATRLIDAAAECGADVVKFQVHVAEAETLPDAPNPPYFNNESRVAYFHRTAFDLETWRGLKARAEQHGVGFLASAFCTEAVRLLDVLGVDAYKVPSGEVTNLAFLSEVAAQRKPVLLSSGMSNLAELDAAVRTIRQQHDRLILLQCTSEYPCPVDRVGLNLLDDLRQRYGRPVGLSDHTMTNYAAFAAVALGACVIEKHFTLSRRMYGSDAAHSLEPAEFAELVRGIQAIDTMLSRPVDKNDLARVQDMKRVFEKSLVTTCDIPAGATIATHMIGVKKPGTGISAARLHDVIGRRATRRIAAHTVLGETDVEWAGGQRS